MRWRSGRVAEYVASCLLSLAGPSATAGPALPTRQPAPDLTTAEAERAYAEAVLLCLRTREARQSVSTPAEFRAAYEPAPAADRWCAGPPLAGGAFRASVPIWESRRLGNLLFVIEPSTSRCEVRATELPVRATFQLAVRSVQQSSPGFQAVGLEPSYNPIAYQLEHVERATRLVVHLEGAEPGAPEHAMRFSLLIGVVVRQPASERPPFR